MLKIQIKNYDEFREIFGTRCSSRGCIQNKVLLAFWKYRFPLDGDGRATSVRTMQDLYNLVISGLSQHPLEGHARPFAIIGGSVNISIVSSKFKTPSGGCIDWANPGNIRYTDTTRVDRQGNAKLCSMGAGKFLRKLIDEHKPRIPESVITYCSEEFQRVWEGEISKMVSGYELVVDKHFDYIYSTEHLFEGSTFSSCMNNKHQWSFYLNFVNASAAYLVKEGAIYARCIIYHDVKTIDGKLHNYAERQYAHNGSELLKTLLINKLIDAGHIDLYKVIGAGCRAVTSIVDAKTGVMLKDPRVSTRCTLTTGGTKAFLDTFKYYYPEKATLTNYALPGNYQHFDMDHTASTYEGPDPTISN